MSKRILVAMAVAAGAAALLPQPASARDTGVFGDARVRCGYFAQQESQYVREPRARLPRYAGAVYRDKRQHGQVHIRHGYWGTHTAYSRCIAGF
jgi:hypothetical protein